MRKPHLAAVWSHLHDSCLASTAFIRGRGRPEGPRPRRLLLTIAALTVLTTGLQRTPVTRAAGVGGLVIPSSGTLLTPFLQSPYFEAWYPSYYDQYNVLRPALYAGGHSGIDIGGGSADCNPARPNAAINRPVYPAAAGTVIWAGWAGAGFGWSVVVRHDVNPAGNGRTLYTLYGHMGTVGASNAAAGYGGSASCVWVSMGQRVYPVGSGNPTVLGDQGSSGLGYRATHVHFTILVGGAPVNRLTTAYIANAYPASPDYYTCMALTSGDRWWRAGRTVRVGQTACAASVTPPAPPTVGGTAAPPAPPGVPSTPSPQLSTSTPGNAQTATVSAVALNVRSGPSRRTTLRTTVRQGTKLTIVQRRNGWYEVQLPDGSTGWVIGTGIGKGRAPAKQRLPGVPGTATATSPITPAPGSATAPDRRPASRTISILVNGLRVHVAPMATSAVIGSVSRGERPVVLARRNGWVQVRLSNGSVGWVSAAYTSPGDRTVGRPGLRRTVPASTAAATMSTVRVATNVRAGPSLVSAIVTVIPPGGAFRILGWARGWARVRTAGGTAGWVSGIALGRTGAAARAAGRAGQNPVTRTMSTRTGRRTVTGITARRSVLTAGVRVHAAPGLKAPVIGMAAAGTRVRVLSTRGAWMLVRLPTGLTGYVSAAYVR